MDYLNIYKEFQSKINAYRYALWLMSWDNQTETPVDAYSYQARQRTYLAEVLYGIMMDPKRIEAIEKLNQQTDLNEFEKREISIVYKSLERMKKIPKDEYLNYQKLQVETSQIYKRAKLESNFSLFLPYLEKIIDYNRKLVKYLETDKLKGYDILLDMYEEDMGVKEYDHFFNIIKEQLVPFIKKIDQKRKTFPKVLTDNTFDLYKQKLFSTYLLDVVGYDTNKGVLKESLHPFTSGAVSVDTRITTAYKENAIDSAIFSTIHEMGHGIYEQQINKDFMGTALGKIYSLGMHESQSRLYENMIGRSKVFWENHFKELQAIFKPEFDDIDYETFYQFVNRVEDGYIRTDADELHYSIHVLIRYEIEKQIFTNQVEAKDLPALWNKLYKDYLGMEVRNDQEGILQDIHWSGGSFGYFPTYALGSAYASQIYNSMNKEIDVLKLIKENKISEINKWLKNNIHTFGSFKTPKEIIKLATNEDFDPSHYVNYLIEKYSALYNI